MTKSRVLGYKADCKLRSLSHLVTAEQGSSQDDKGPVNQLKDQDKGLPPAIPPFTLYLTHEEMRRPILTLQPQEGLEKLGNDHQNCQPPGESGKLHTT